MWLYLAVATAILTAVTVPLAAGARVLALSVANRAPAERPDELDPEQRALIEQFY